MRVFHWLIIVSIVGCVLPACSSFVIHEKIDVPVRKVALLSIPPVRNYFVEEITPNVLQRGANLKISNELFESEGFNFSAYLEETIISQLASKGIEVIVISVHREGSQNFFERFDTIDAQLKHVDVVLEVLPTSPGYHFGPYGERSLGRLRPIVGVSAQLISIRTHKVLYRDRFGYGYDVPMTPDGNVYVFEDIRTLESSPNVAIAGLKHATRAVVTYLVSQFAP